MDNKYHVDLCELYDTEIKLLTDVFKDIGARNGFRLNQEGEDLFRLKCKEITDEIAKHVINSERKLHNI